MPMKNSSRPTKIAELPNTTLGTGWVIFTDDSYQHGGDEYSSPTTVEYIGMEVFHDSKDVAHEVERRTRAGLKFRCYKLGAEVKAEITVQVNLE